VIVLETAIEDLAVNHQLGLDFTTEISKLGIESSIVEDHGLFPPIHHCFAPPAVSSCFAAAGQKAQFLLGHRPAESYLPHPI
jgi:hypothetical protein